VFLLCNLDSLSDGKIFLMLLYTLLLYMILLLYTSVFNHVIVSVFDKGLQKSCVEALQNGNAHLANNDVDDFCW